MKKSINLWQLWGFALTSFLGTLLHFLYDWTDKATWSALFSGVNESTWEHMKLLFFPAFFFAIIQSFFFRETENFWCVKLRGTALGLSLIPLLFYTYNGVIGKSPDAVNIAIFFISAASIYLYEWNLLKKANVRCKHPKIALIMLCVIALLFVLFTFRTPQLNIFKDPITNTYGI
ncbi:MAG: hypothetical protein IKA84_02960 [Clostridia bacterium]|nr:hypothetical protein [Clostridia bacterium]